MKNPTKCIWFTGLPCSGKTTLALALKKYIPCCMHLDGDDVRATALGENVSFDPEDRKNHILRMGAIAKIAVDSGITVLCSFVSPDRKTRDEVRQMFDVDEFVEVFVDADVTVCERRDVKGMYAKARSGQIVNFTGVDARYEPPLNPEIVIDTRHILRICVEILIRRLIYFKESTNNV
jgi:adenylyl-sulfate kinase